MLLKGPCCFYTAFKNSLNLKSNLSLVLLQVWKNSERIWNAAAHSLTDWSFISLDFTESLAMAHSSLSLFVVVIFKKLIWVHVYYQDRKWCNLEIKFRNYWSHSFSEPSPLQMYDDGGGNGHANGHALPTFLPLGLAQQCSCKSQKSVLLTNAPCFGPTPFSYSDYNGKTNSIAIQMS